ncbi:MAG: VOC family protein [Phycisphaerales bacterium]|nr:VOC family protein [Phycisphaerales bacterium]
MRLAAITVVMLSAGPAAAWAQLAVTAAATQQPPPVGAVDTIGITVGDLDRQVEFFTRVLDFQMVSETEVWGEPTEHLTGVFGARCRVARLRLGDECVELTEFLAPAGRPVPPESRSNDRWFQHIAIVVSDMDRAYARLRTARVRHASTGPQTLPAWNPAAGGISAFYFKDPEDHVLEVIHFPSGKGDPKWQQPGDRLFLGIDHTAIVVQDTAQSLQFYRGVLGLRVAGQSENYGTEQEHLNNVCGARLLITSLRAERGPGVELLEYLAPSDGREYPRDARACDLFQWQTTFVAPDLESLASHCRTAGAVWISPGVIPGGHGPAAMTIRDPDGHALRISNGESGVGPRAGR